MKKVFLVLAAAAALAASAALAAETDSSYGLSREETVRFEEAGKKVKELIEAGAPKEEIEAATAEVQKIYNEFRAKSEAEIAKFGNPSQDGK